MTYKEIRDLLVKVEDMRWNESLTSDDLDSIARLLKGELDRKSDRQTGPAIGQQYWIHRLISVAPYVYKADDFDINAGKYRDLYPEERYAEAELRAMELIQGVNKRRRELNEGKEIGNYKYYIVYLNKSDLGTWESSNLLYARGNAYPFGLFKDSADCKMCIHDFDGELKWFFTEYLPLMAELDDYDWADAPGWGDKA